MKFHRTHCLLYIHTYLFSENRMCLSYVIESPAYKKRFNFTLIILNLLFYVLVICNLGICTHVHYCCLNSLTIKSLAICTLVICTFFLPFCTFVICTLLLFVQSCHFVLLPFVLSCYLYNLAILYYCLMFTCHLYDFYL